ncbi:MAG: Xaa-Pro peptidase family protein [Firmicutes bacterium]|nr:Xaa-Pro peptidase family protein [Bacillota bacterium]
MRQDDALVRGVPGGQDRGAVGARRLEAVRRALETQDPRPGAFVVASPENRRYVTGFTGSSGAAVITGDRAVFVTDFRYVDQAHLECPGWEVVRHGPVMADTLAEMLRGLDVKTVGFEREQATYAFYDELAVRLRDKGIELIPVGPVVERVREIKEEDEIALIRAAADIADRALGEVIHLIRPGIAERDIALEVEYRMRKLGADGAAFPTIVASGPRAALPHGRASDKTLAAGELVTVDMGAVVRGYCSDLTRTFIIGPLGAEEERVYRLVLEAQEKALAAIRPGMTGREADAVARDVIVAAGHGEHFGHGLGHAVGLAVHESPRLSPTSDRVLEAGHVVTVEPGVYVSGWGGVRIEDLVVLRAGEVEVLSRFPKKLMVL